MDFSIQKRANVSKNKYSSTSRDIAYKFTKKIHIELKDFLKAVVLFGSTARDKQDANDIDILLIIDDVSVEFNQEMVQAYRIIVENTVAKVSPKIHITSMKFTTFWEYIRSGDPIAINILRDGFALIDTGFFDPLQLLLHQGRIRPSPEALWSYFNRAPRTLKYSKGRLLQATIDLYWAVIDASHAALMSINEVPPSPDHVADLLEQKFVKKKLLDRKYPGVMRKLYILSKEILHGKKREITGREFDSLEKEVEDYIKVIEKLIKK